MTKYFEVLVEFRLESENSKGEVKTKKVKETYLVDAEFVTEAEARVVESFSSVGNLSDYSVLQVVTSKITKIIPYENL